MKNYYEILEVNEKASKEIINKIFKIHIKKSHPDLFTGEEKLKMEEKMKLLNEAYEVLSDDDKRKKYDDSLKEESSVIIDEKTSLLIQENEFLKQLVQKKDKMIEEFLNDVNTDNDTLPNNFIYAKTNYSEQTLNNPYEEDYCASSKNNTFHYKNPIIDFFYKNRIFIFKLIFSTVLAIIGLISMNNLVGSNLILDIFKQFSK